MVAKVAAGSPSDSWQPASIRRRAKQLRCPTALALCEANRKLVRLAGKVHPAQLAGGVADVSHVPRTGFGASPAFGGSELMSRVGSWLRYLPSGDRDCAVTSSPRRRR